MPVVFANHGYGVMVVDRNKNILWEWPKEVIRTYGLCIDSKTGHLYVGDVEEVYELTRAGTIVWKYKHPKLQGLHSVTLTPKGNLLCACSKTDRVLEINKKKGIVWEWWAGDHFTIPGYYKDYTVFLDDRLNYVPSQQQTEDWTHLNYAKRLEDGDTLISLYRHPEDLKGGLLLRVNKAGKIVWSWGGEKHIQTPHFIAQVKDGYLISDTNARRLFLFCNDRTLDVIRGYAVHHVDFLAGEHMLLAIPKPKSMILEIDWLGREYWRYEPPKGKMVYTALHVDEWDVEFNEKEKEAIVERLKALGYMQ